MSETAEVMKEKILEALETVIIRYLRLRHKL